ncbi:LOW QUALITY PROTEIN: hypothetical protein PHMEG_0007504 [Phytophthora megakarya]|uniref:Retrotransposon gag domain-containing protein n=1 Tax=Phytophthora megakarya TaxID=4795 RepID=A0A225WMP1_9STRA|nr:LOW QUALITY PROTEIN: hypothetical protein PHMEG_0007504 [Phytophthora megakarya]
MEEMDPTPRFEIAQHRPLVKITPFLGKLDESENFMQGLRVFVYEMKGTHTSQRMVHGLPTEAQRWGRTLVQSSISKDESDKFISYYYSQFSQSASTQYYRAKRSEKKHIRDYHNRLNGYTRSANIMFGHSGREAKEHVKKIWRHRDLERQLTPIQLRDIHTLEDIVSDIYKVEKRVSSRSSSQSSSTRDDKRHSSSSGSYGRHDCRTRSQERSRSEPHNTSRVLVDASVTDLITELQTRTSLERPNEYSNDYSNDDPIEFYEGDKADQDECDSDCGSKDELQGDFQRLSYGPCAACGGQNHSTHFSFRRCRLCLQVHSFSKCEAFDELAKTLRTNVDKKNISPELQKLVFGGHLN